MKLLFWNIFDDADPGMFGCNKLIKSRYVAMILYACYMLTTCIVIINTLIAIMNNSVKTLYLKQASWL